MKPTTTTHVVDYAIRKRTLSAPTRNVLVTGGAGFIGSHLCDRHIAKGDRVICLDDLSTGRTENIAHLLDHKRFVFVRHDVIEPYEIEGALDLIYNMACPASPPKYQRDPIRTTATCFSGAMNALLLAEKKAAVVVQASTSEIYGDPDLSPQSEEYWGNVNSFGTRSCYDEGKRVAESLFHDFRDRRGVRVRIARIFNTYGPRMDPNDGRVVSNFICQALKGEDITVFGDGSQTRSFCYIDDLLNGLMALANAPDTVNYPVNLGNPGEFTISELRDIVCDLIGSASGTRFMDLPQDDPKQRKPDISRARSVLAWKPRITLREGLEKTAPYFAAELQSGKQVDFMVG